VTWLGGLARFARVMPFFFLGSFFFPAVVFGFGSAKRYHSYRQIPPSLESRELHCGGVTYHPSSFIFAFLQPRDYCVFDMKGAVERSHGVGTKRAQGEQHARGPHVPLGLFFFKERYVDPVRSEPNEKRGQSLPRKREAVVYSCCSMF